MKIQSRLLGNGFAAEIEGIDLAAIDEATLTALRDSWLQHKVVVLREQTLDDDALVNFTKRMGPLFVHVRDQFHAPNRPEIMYISNLREDGEALGALGNGELHWHSDQTYSPRPVFGTLLYAIEVPVDGCDTWFGDLAAAYAAMPSDLREEVEGQTATYSINKQQSSAGRLPLRPDQIDSMPDRRHPLVRTHPYLERKALYLSPDHMTRIGDLDHEASMAMLERLVAWATRPEFVYRHQWCVGDVVFWDNTSVMHRRDGFPSQQRRFLKRTGFHLPESLGIPF